jgi:hypothetical protein
MTNSFVQGARFLIDLRDFLRQPMSAAEAHERLRVQLEGRTTSFLDIVRRGIFDNPASPYLPLLKQAGITYPSGSVVGGQKEARHASGPGHHGRFGYSSLSGGA